MLLAGPAGMAARRLARRCQLEMSGGGVGVWSEVIALARIAGVIDLGQGWPDVPPSEVATAEAARILQDRSAAGRKQNQYSPIGGAPALCTAVSEMHRTLYGDALDPASEVYYLLARRPVVRAGSQALLNLCRCLQFILTVRQLWQSLTRDDAAAT